MNVRTIQRLTEGLAALLLMTGLAATAAPVTWNLKDVTFTDGGTASGSFVYDADLNTYSGINITTSGGATPGATYGTVHSLYGASPTLLPVVAAFPPVPADLTGANVLYLPFDSQLTNAGGTIDFAVGAAFLGSEETCGDPICSGGDVLRFVSSGQFTAQVPEPSTMALLMLSLFGAGYVSRRRNRAP